MRFRGVGALAALLAVTGCATGPSSQELEAIDRQVKDAQVRAPAAQPRQAADGSLWGRNQQQVFSDNKANQVGDIITVQLTENTEGSNSATTEASRDASNSAGVSAFFGTQDGIPGEDPATAVETETANSLDGTGETSRSASLSGNMTAVVVRVFPNGNMRIKGRRAVTINEEVQNMVLSGIIRPEDIGTDNSITSSQIANARIQYAGRGVVARQQDEGWMTKVLHTVWPF